MTDITTPQAPASDRPADQAAHQASTARGEATGLAGAAKDQVASVATTAAGEARAVASEAAAEAKDLFADARQQLRSQADEQSAKVAALVGDIGGQLRRMASAGDTGPAKDIVAAVADQADSISRHLRDGGLDRTLEDARRLARNQPGLFLAGAALVGFVAARVARTADTGALKQAASPSGGTNGAAPSASGSSPDPLRSAPPMTPQEPAAPTLTAPPAVTATEGWR